MSERPPDPRTLSRAGIETLVLLHAFGGEARTPLHLTQRLGLHPALKAAVAEALLGLLQQRLVQADDERARFQVTPTGTQRLRAALDAIA